MATESYLNNFNINGYQTMLAATMLNIRQSNSVEKSDCLGRKTVGAKKTGQSDESQSK